MTNQPLVSIIINNFNYDNFLSEAIDSAINQTYSPIEVIVVDDGSTDNSEQIIRSYEDRIIPIFKENNGQASALNTGFAASKGEIICLLDSDDVFVTEKVAEIVKIFTEHPAVEWCFHPLRLVEKSTGSLLAESYNNGASRECDFRKEMKQGRLSFSGPPTSGLCFRRSLSGQIFPMPDILLSGSDRYLVALAPALSKGFYLDKKLTVQGIHGDNVNTFQEGEKVARRRAYIELVVAYFMRQKLPDYHKITDRIFARGLGIYWKIGYKTAIEKELVNNYISGSSLLEKIKTYLIAMYQNRPWKKEVRPGKKRAIAKV